MDVAILQENLDTRSCAKLSYAEMALRGKERYQDSKRFSTPLYDITADTHGQQHNHVIVCSKKNSPADNSVGWRTLKENRCIEENSHQSTVQHRHGIEVTK